MFLKIRKKEITEIKTEDYKDSSNNCIITEIEEYFDVFSNVKISMDYNHIYDYSISRKKINNVVLWSLNDNGIKIRSITDIYSIKVIENGIIITLTTKKLDELYLNYLREEKLKRIIK